MNFYILQKPEAYWGDYGDILIHGMSAYAERVDGKIQLYRTGPFIPPISFPGICDVVVTNEFRTLLSDHFKDLTFLPVVKAHIATVNWEEWDTSVDDPLYYPESGEPEDYILGKPNDPVSANKMGALWELVVPEVQIASEISDWARISGNRRVIVSERVKTLLEGNVAKWVRLQFIPTDWLR